MLMIILTEEQMLSQYFNTHHCQVSLPSQDSNSSVSKNIKCDEGTFGSICLNDFFLIFINY